MVPAYRDGSPRESADNCLGAQRYAYFIADGNPRSLWIAMMESISGSPNVNQPCNAVSRSRQHLGVAQGLLAAVENHARTPDSVELHLVLADVTASGEKLAPEDRGCGN